MSAFIFAPGDTEATRCYAPWCFLEVPRENVWSSYLSRRTGGRIAYSAVGEAPRRRHVRRGPVVQSPKDPGRAARPARRLVQQQRDADDAADAVEGQRAAYGGRAHRAADARGEEC